MTTSHGRFRLCLMLLCLLAPGWVEAHPGRRFEIQVVDGRIVAQGVNTKSAPPMGESPVRPYPNVVHDHFDLFVLNGQPIGSANLPGLDIPADTPLAGHSVYAEVTGFYLTDAEQVAAATAIGDALQPLGEDQEVRIRLNQTDVSSRALPAQLTIAGDIPAAGVADIDPVYHFVGELGENFVVIEMQLRSDAPGIAASGPVYIVMAPPGMQYHMPALRLEIRLVSGTGGD
ncbi:hypothetical protein E4634_06895 [Mangrovimicrobium sediminis]|uniref:Uncharacterized protein n=1 Tax=Mangrovimicrobium sediminis TaxID=2562682 RepID=A0A4Z0M334_9GAMM|nr:hypothetical protein [Haliea sp. SAOS-164]TGD73864.1 hypothetical protein E4634_06895 [Haliea sp. SAOS-164]